MERRSNGGKHQILMTDREVVKIEGVTQVVSFNEEKIVLETVLGFLNLDGEGLHITQLDLDAGNLTVEGYVAGIEYTEDLKAKGKGFVKQLFR